MRSVGIRIVTVLALTGGLLAQQAAAPKEEAKDQKPASTQAAATQTAPPAPKPEVAPAKASLDPKYLIGEGDVLNINVWREPEVSRAVPVRPDGKISLPLVGEIQAMGLTPKQLEESLTKKLEEFVSNPTVTVIVQQVNSVKYNIMGEVGKPGSYPLIKPMTVLEAIASAGGLKEFARPDKIYILRRLPNGQTQRIPFNYKQVLKGEAMEQNIELEQRDTIVVP